MPYSIYLAGVANYLMFTIWHVGNIGKKEHEKIEKYQGLWAQLERMQGVETLVIPVVIGAQLWPQLLGTAKILRRPLVEDQKLMEEQIACGKRGINPLLTGATVH